MTFTTQIKEEITKEENNNIEDLTSLCTYLKFNATLEEDKMTVMVVNASVARWIFKLLKTNYNVLIKLTFTINNTDENPFLLEHLSRQTESSAKKERKKPFHIV